MTSADNHSPARGDDVVRFCRERAVECLAAAEAAPDLDTRDEWILLANKWTHTALHTNRAIQAAAEPKRDIA
jgi:hypothetical protein